MGRAPVVASTRKVCWAVVLNRSLKVPLAWLAGSRVANAWWRCLIYWASMKATAA